MVNLSGGFFHYLNSNAMANTLPLCKLRSGEFLPVSLNGAIALSVFFSVICHGLGLIDPGG